MHIPRPFAIAIDDLGWMDGENEGYLGQGPYRIGIKRKMDITDYEAVIDLAKKVGVRLQGLFILGELDREYIARNIPTITPTQTAWKDKKSDLQIKVMDFVKKHASHLEFGLHGVGHEYWPDNSGNFKRAEWYNLDDKHPWPEESIRTHLDCFSKIMAQYGLTPSNHQSFPESFVPCAYSYYWNPFPKPDEYSLGTILSEYGVRYANTDFTQIPECSPPIDGGFDQGVHVMNRFNYGNLWHMIGQLPMIPIKYQNTDFIETHWPNLLAQDTFLQEGVTKKWVEYYHEVNSHEKRYYSKNTAQHHSQFLYCKYTTLFHYDYFIIIDNSKMPTDNAHDKIVQNLVLKIPIEKKQHIQYITLEGKSIPAYYEFGGYAYLFLPKLSNRKYTLNYTFGKSLPQDIIWHDSTCNIHQLDFIKNTVTIKGRFYGTQSIQFLTKCSIESIHSNTPLVEIISWKENALGVEINFSTKDIQGVTAELNLNVIPT